MTVVSVNGSLPDNLHRRLAALVAATGRSEIDLLEECIQLLALKSCVRTTSNTAHHFGWTPRFSNRNASISVCSSIALVVLLAP
jgi:hypothetical protein